jgi:methylmalonyl-CoA mutase N-terminal domain/subunit
VQSIRSSRDSRATAAALEKLRSAATTNENLLPLIVDAVKTQATLGEISDVLRAQWGIYRGVAA